MNLERKLNDYKKTMKIIPNEHNIEETIKKSIDTFCAIEQERLLNYWEFLWGQLRVIRKRWWIFQFLILLALWLSLPSLQSDQLMQRAMGVVAALFVILIIPELWKNQTYQSMEIESTAYYSLKQIYAARMLLFGIVDIVLVSFFCGLASVAWNVTFSQLVVQFILPMVVTSCICFGILCSKYPLSEVFAVTMCVLWSAVWILVILNEPIYASVAFPLWLAILGIALVFLIVTIYQTIYRCNNYWEVNSNGIEIR